MRKHQTRNIILALIIAASVALTGCGPSILKEESSAQTEEPAAQTQEQESVAIQSIDDTAPESTAGEMTESAAAAAEEAAPQEGAAEETPAAEAADGSEPGLEPAGGKALSVEIGTTYLTEYNEETYTQICSVVYPTVLLAQGDEILYSGLENALESKNEKFRREANNAFERLQAEVRQYADINDENFTGYSDEQSLFVIRADDRILSLGGTAWTYTGGAHPQYTFTALNFDTETGRELSVRDIAKDPVALMDKVKEILAQQYPGMEENLIDSADMVSEGVADTTGWTMGYDCFTIRFGAGQLGAYAQGAQIISVPFAGNEALFNEKYLSIPDSYGYEMMERYTDLDANGDGALEHLEMSPQMNEDGYFFDSLKISLGGNVFSDECTDAYDFTPYIVRANNKTFLYVQYACIDDYNETAVFDITGGTAVLSGRVPYRIHKIYDEETGESYRFVLSDPEYAVIGTRSDVLGTNNAYGYIHVGEDGMPVLDDGLYLIREVQDGYPMTLKRDIEAERIDPETKESAGTIMLPAGLTVDPYRTDLTTFVEVTTENGDLVRFSYTPGWPNYVNGIDTEEVFNNIMYAG